MAITMPNQSHVLFNLTKELHTRPYMVMQKRCVWNKKNLLGSVNFICPLAADILEKLVLLFYMVASLPLV